MVDIEMTKPNTTEHGDMRQRILEAAEGVFAEKGYAATTISNITECAGIGRALIYYYFKDKRTLYYSILEDGNEKILGISKEAQAFDGQALDKLRLFMTRFSQMLVDRQSIMRIAIRDGADGSQEVAKHRQKGMEEVLAVLRQIIEGGIVSGELHDMDAEKTAHMLIGMTHALVFMRVRCPRCTDSHANIDHAISILSKGIAV